MPSTPRQPQEVVSVRLPAELHARLDSLVERTQRSRSTPSAD
ncbi:ribbon-helix-helix protein, CopG family [Arthrobacter sp. STN4]|nr:ribbon-helix-helix protein, CopG family [Arthrobacter sp. STN4]MCQ9164758.1 ribbon-helix-helix domain-containing protein [Arthrobacter sp. STN4]